MVKMMFRVVSRSPLSRCIAIKYPVTWKKRTTINTEKAALICLRNRRIRSDSRCGQTKIIIVIKIELNSPHFQNFFLKLKLYIFHRSRSLSVPFFCTSLPTSAYRWAPAGERWAWWRWPSEWQCRCCKWHQRGPSRPVGRCDGWRVRACRWHCTDRRTVQRPKKDCPSRWPRRTAAGSGSRG